MIMTFHFGNSWRRRMPLLILVLLFLSVSSCSDDAAPMVSESTETNTEKNLREAELALIDQKKAIEKSISGIEIQYKQQKQKVTKAAQEVTELEREVAELERAIAVLKNK